MTAATVQLTLTGFPKRYIGSKPVDVLFNGKSHGSVPKGSTVTMTFPTGGRFDFVTHYMGRERRQSFQLPDGTVADLVFDFGPMGGLKVLERGGSSVDEWEVEIEF
jgi:hypothetical protein